jgi:hypothetical protein
MALDLVDYELKAREAVKAFWGNREAARQKQIGSSKTGQGERAGVTAGKNMGSVTTSITEPRKPSGRLMIYGRPTAKRLSASSHAPLSAG